MSEPIKTVGVVVIQSNKVLLVRHSEQSSHVTGSYGFPAGRVEAGETDVEAALRELEEETGLHAKIEALREIPTIYEAMLERKDGAKLFVMKAFRVDDFSGELRSSQETFPEWIPLSQLDAFPLLTNVNQAIHDALQLCQS